MAYSIYRQRVRWDCMLHTGVGVAVPVTFAVVDDEAFRCVAMHYVVLICVGGYKLHVL